MKELTLAATLENIPVVTAFVDEQLEALGCPVKAQMQIDIAIDELFGNIAHYAYPDGTGDATVRLDFDEDMFKYIEPRNLGPTKMYLLSFLREHSLHFPQDVRIGEDMTFNLIVCVM